INLFIKNYRTDTPIENVRIIAKGFKFSWLTDSNGQAKLNLTSYDDSVQVTVGLIDFEEKTFWITPDIQAKTIALMPEELAFPTRPSMPYSIIEEPVTTSIKNKFFVRAVTSEEVIDEANNDSIETTKRVAQVTFIPPLGANGITS